MNQNEIELFVKNYIRAYLLQIREQNKFSQEKVANLLDTSRRGYVKLESDESCCDAVTLLLILFVVEKDPREFISKMREEFVQLRKSLPILSLSDLFEMKGITPQEYRYPHQNAHNKHPSQTL